MKAKTFLFLLLALALAVNSFAYVGGVKWQYIGTSGPALTTMCGSGDCLPAGGTVYIYKDGNLNGCDAATGYDWHTYTPGAVLGADVIWPIGTTAGLCNYNNKPTNASPSCGFFTYGSTVWRNYGGTVTGDNVRTLYLVVYYESVATGKHVWVSEAHTFADNTGQVNWYPAIWTCYEVLSAVPPCVQSQDVTFDGYIHAPQDPIIPAHQACATICPNAPLPLKICVGPLVGQDRIPRVTVTPGCVTCDPPSSCTPAQGFIWAGGFADGWVWTALPGGNYYCKTITWGANPVGGCVCIKFEAILPVSFGTAELTPMDNAVKMSWNTHSETNLDKFIVLRNSAKIAEVRATNTATEHTYSYTDESATNGTTYSYSLVMHHSDGTEEVLYTASSTPSLMNAVVTEYALRQNYPNPFNPTTNIIYDVKASNFVTLKVYNATGQEVATLVNGSKDGGHRYSVSFDAGNLPSGLYFYSIKIGNEFNATKKMLLVK